MSEIAVCFVHIERCGGTTLNHLLRVNFSSFLDLNPKIYWAEDATGGVCTIDQLRLLFRIFPFTRGVGGHTVRSYLNYEHFLGRKFFYFTFLRNPIKRYLSHFNYRKIHMKERIEIDDFLACERYQNFMTCRIAGSPNLNKAIHILENQYSFVGLTEHFQESVVLLKYKLGNSFKPFYQLKNKLVDSQYYLKISDLDDSTINNIKQQNSIDIALYNYLKEKIFPKQIRNYHGNFEKNVAYLKATNNDFHFPIIKVLTNLFFKKILLAFVEKTCIRSKALQKH